MADESKSGSEGPCNELFKGFPLSLFELPPTGDIVVIPSDASIAEAVAILGKANILAAPVRDVSCTHPNPEWHELYLGLFSMTDAVYAALKMDELMAKHLPSVSETQPADEVASFSALLASHAYFTSTPVTKALHTFKFGPFVPLEEDSDTSLLDVALILGKYGQHRVVVVQPSVGDGAEETMADVVAVDRRLKNIITQSALISFVARDSIAAKLASVTSKTLAELGLAKPGNVVKVKIQDPVVDCFHAIADHGVSAVAVVDLEGKLVGCVSNRDARVLVTGRHALSMLHGPVSKLIQRSHGSANICHPSIRARPSDTLATIIARMAASRIHRIFVVDDEGVPVAVVSLTDVLATLVTEPTPDYFHGFFDAAVSASGGAEE